MVYVARLLEVVLLNAHNLNSLPMAVGTQTVPASPPNILQPCAVGYHSEVCNMSESNGTTNTGYNRCGEERDDSAKTGQRVYALPRERVHTHTPPSFRLSLFDGSVAPNRDGPLHWQQWLVAGH